MSTCSFFWIMVAAALETDHLNICELECFCLFHNSLLNVQFMSELDFSSLPPFFTVVMARSKKKTVANFASVVVVLDCINLKNTRSQNRIYSAWRITLRNYLKLGNLDVVQSPVTKLKLLPHHPHSGRVNFMQTSHALPMDGIKVSKH